jgi:DUF971 family protein
MHEPRTLTLEKSQAMSQSAPWPVELRVSKDRRILTVTFDSGEVHALSAEYLRVMAPSADVQGHTPAEKKTVSGKRDVAIVGADPIGNYAVRLSFDDLHANGIYVWDYFLSLGRDRDRIWNGYLAELEAKGLTR